MPYKDKARNNEYHRQNHARRHLERKTFAHAFLGGSCASCQGREGLEIDHIDPSIKSFTIGKRWMCAWNIFLEELAKCQLLCKACHKEKTKRDGAVR